MKPNSLFIPKNRHLLTDFYAACLLLSKHQELNEIRRDLNPQPGAATIGVGSLYTPSRLHFGHPVPDMVGSHEPLTPLGRVLLADDQYQSAGITWPWLYPLELREAVGTTEVSAHLNCSTETLNRLTSPLDEIIMKEFQTYLILDETSQLFHQMIYLGDCLWKQLHEAETLLNEVRAKHRIIDVDGIKVMLLQDLEGDNYESIISRFVMLEARDVSISVKPDTKGNGWALFKFRTSPVNLDFRRLNSHPEIAYCQSRGTLVKTKSRCDEATISHIVNLSRVV